MTDQKNLDFYLNQYYTIELKPYGDGSYFARILELPGCVAEGESLEETMKNIEQAKEAWLEVALEEGEEIPLPPS
jgi:antitoxin HicB